MTDRLSDTTDSQSAAETSNDRAAAPWIAAARKPRTADSGPGPADPADGAHEPSGTADQPSDPAGEPSGTVGEPSGPAGEPSGTVGEPSGTADQPSGTADQPSGPAGEPGGAGVDTGLEREPGDVERSTADRKSRLNDDHTFNDTPLMAEDAQVHVRWQEIQAAFVDDPRDSVTRAAGLAEEVVTTVVAPAQERVSDLRDVWDGNSADTEQLRNALRRYRMLINRLGGV